MIAAALRGIFEAAIAACDPRAVVREALEIVPVDGGVRMIAMGKAAVAMATGAVEAWGERIVEGLVIHPDGIAAADALARFDVRAAAHPMPDERSEAAGRAALALAARVAGDETMLVLVSGGASALAAAPIDGVSLAEKRAAIAALMAAGAPIAALAKARQARSALKGGKLAAASAGRVVTLVASDVPGDDVAVVGSGPTVPARDGDVVQVVAGLYELRAQAAAAAFEAGWEVAIEEDDLVGDVAEVAERVVAAAAALAPGAMWIGGGEWTVALAGGAGQGGRASELALRVAQQIADDDEVIVLVGASDGVDGTGPDAGAVVECTTWARIGAAGIDPAAALAAHDSGRALAAAGDAIAIGPTGVNHADLVIVARIAAG